MRRGVEGESIAARLAAYGRDVAARVKNVPIQYHRLRHPRYLRVPIRNDPGRRVHFRKIKTGLVSDMAELAGEINRIARALDVDNTWNVFKGADRTPAQQRAGLGIQRGNPV